MPEMLIGKIPVDTNGRTVIPVQIRKRLGLQPHDFFDVAVDTQSNQVILRRAGDRCIVCSSQSSLVSYHKVTLCKTCLEEFRHQSRNE